MGMDTKSMTPPVRTAMPIGWERRPSGGTMFVPGKRHLLAAVDRPEEIASLRTLCGALVPIEVLREMRGVSRNSSFIAVAMLDDRDLAAVDACRRCEASAARQGSGS